EVELFVGRMDSIVLQAEADQERVVAQRVLDHADYGNRAAASDQYRLLRVDLRQPAHGGLQPRRIAGHANGAGHAEGLDLPAAVGRRARVEEGLQTREDLLRILSRYQAAAQLGGRVRGDHRLGAGAGIAAIDAVQVAGRP